MKAKLENSADNQFLAEIYSDGVILSEINLIRNPFFILSRSELRKLLLKTAEQGEPQIIYRYKDEVASQERVWIVTPDAQRGYAGAFDKKVFAAVLKLITDNSFPPSNPVALGSLRTICKTMGIESNSGRNRNLVKESLKRIATTSIETNTFYLKKEKGYWKEREQGGVFSLWDVYWKGEKLPNGEQADSIYLWLHPPFLLSLITYYVKPLDYNYYMSLSPLAQRVYELTSLKFFGLKDSPYVKYKYLEYCQALPITPQRYFNDAKMILGRAHKQLLKTGFLRRVQWQGSSRLKPWYILYYPGERALKEIEFAKGRLKRFQFAHKGLKTPESQARIELWASDIYEALGDKTNMPYYRKLARLIVERKIPEQVVFETLSETKYEAHEGRVDNRSAYFTFHLKRRLKERGIDLNTVLKKASDLSLGLPSKSEQERAIGGKAG